MLSLWFSSDDVEELLKEKKCQLAFTTVVDVVNFSTADRLLIPRLDTNDLPKKRQITQQINGIKKPNRNFVVMDEARSIDYP